MSRSSPTSRSTGRWSCSPASVSEATDRKTGGQGSEKAFFQYSASPLSFGNSYEKRVPHPFSYESTTDLEDNAWILLEASTFARK